MVSIDKCRALNNFKSLEKNNPKKFKQLKSEFENMSSGGDGGPLRIGYRWTVVRTHYYSKWSDEDFRETLEAIKKN